MTGELFLTTDSRTSRRATSSNVFDNQPTTTFNCNHVSLYQGLVPDIQTVQRSAVSGVDKTHSWLTEGLVPLEEEVQQHTACLKLQLCEKIATAPVRVPLSQNDATTQNRSPLSSQSSSIIMIIENDWVRVQTYFVSMHVLQARWGECSVIAAVAGPQDEPKTYTEPLVSEGCPVLWYDYEFATPDSDLPARLSVRHPDIMMCVVLFRLHSAGNHPLSSSAARAKVERASSLRPNRSL